MRISKIFVSSRLGTIESVRFMALSLLGVAQVDGLALVRAARLEQLHGATACRSFNLLLSETS